MKYKLHVGIISLHLLSLMFLCFLVVSCGSQNEQCKNLIYVEEFGDYVQIESFGSTIEIASDDIIYEVVFSDCFGSMSIVGYSGKAKILEGNYSGEEVLRTDTLFAMDYETEEIVRDTFYRYHRPVKKGRWKYWKEDGTLEKEEEY